MKCEEFIEHMPEYWDDELNELQRFAVDQHRKSCPSCAQEFLFWEESEALIASTAKDETDSIPSFTISQNVMARIYEEKKWAAPVNRRPFILTDQFRGWLSLISAAMFILFVGGFLFSSTLADDSLLVQRNEIQLVGVQPVGSASTVTTTEASGELFYGVVASIGEPATLPMEESWIRKTYAISLSLLGLTFIVGVMSWISRARTAE